MTSPKRDDAGAPIPHQLLGSAGHVKALAQHTL